MQLHGSAKSFTHQSINQSNLDERNEALLIYERS